MPATKFEAIDNVVKIKLYLKRSNLPKLKTQLENTFGVSLWEMTSRSKTT